MPGGAANPVRQRRAVQIDTLTGEDLRLPVKRQMVSVFGDEHVPDRCLRWNTASDQPRWRRSLDYDLLARPARVLATARHQHAEASGQNVQAFGDVLTDPVQACLAAGACLVVDLDHRLNAWQMRRQRTAVRAALPYCCCALRREFVFRFRCYERFGLLDIFEPEQHLVFGQRLGAATKAVAL